MSQKYSLNSTEKHEIKIFYRIKSLIERDDFKQQWLSDYQRKYRFIVFGI